MSKKYVRLTLNDTLQEKFNAVKKELGCSTDAEVFKILLNKKFDELELKV